MYKKLERSKAFIKDLQKISFSNEHYSKYVVYLGKILSNQPLPPEGTRPCFKGRV